ncbi:MAG: DUF3536 domain-containing protein [Acidobacteriota bacterium]
MKQAAIVATIAATNSIMNVYLTIHCHFYQPPRENPWIEEIERQDSAAPFHDWNDRIAHECFTPNGWARINDSQARVLDIVNNYRYISFNVGPTLMSWLEQKAPHTYQRILEADRQSCAERSGHGNAIAQVYNHMILPLANRRDKITQVRWGLADFRYRFGREAESIWLAETAVDAATLEVLIEHGIKYIILCPTQAARCRPIGSSHWIDVSGGQIDPTRPYRCFLTDGSARSLDIFFYDGPISRSIGFDNLLHDAKRLVERFQLAISSQREHTQLISAATDGETYGHHKPLGEMALAYAVMHEASKRGFVLTNYGEFLEVNPPTWEVELKPVSAWSCVHGVSRWTDDCGCHTGGAQGWRQHWRRPLREALDWLRDRLTTLYEQEAAEYLRDPWAARNDYINVILDRTPENINAFFERQQQHELDNEDRMRAILLLEIQRYAMLMYTSCAWFFSEISGIETIQVLRYAARAIQLAEEFVDEDWEGKFLHQLERAPSNIPGYGTGAGVYRQLVRPSVVRLERIANHYAVSSLFEELPKLTRLFCFNADRLDYERQQLGRLTLAVGRLKLKSIITTETRDFAFGLLHAGGRDFYCAVRAFPGQAHYRQIKADIFERFPDQSLMEVIRTLDDHFGPYCYTFKDLFIEKRRDILRRVSDDLLKRFSQTYEHIYQENMRIMMALKADGLPVPAEYRIAAEYTLSERLNHQIDQLTDLFDPECYKEIMEIIDEAEEYGYRLNYSHAAEILSTTLNDLLLTITLIPNSNLIADAFNEVARFLILAARLRINLQLRRAQDIYFAFLNERFSTPEVIAATEAGDATVGWRKAALELGRRLSLNVERFEISQQVSTAAD